MNRQMTLGRLLAILVPFFLILIGWWKVHEDRQDEKSTENSNAIIKHAEQITSLEEFKKDIKIYQKKQDSNHIETLEAISGLTTSIEVLVERVEHK